MINQEHIDSIKGPLKAILEEELNRGNVIRETWDHWPQGVISISLEYEFITPINKNISGVEYLDIDDRHYWKAQYFDEKNKVLLVCGFGQKKMKVRKF